MVILEKIATATTHLLMIIMICEFLILLLSILFSFIKNVYESFASCENFGEVIVTILCLIFFICLILTLTYCSIDLAKHINIF